MLRFWLHSTQPRGRDIGNRWDTTLRSTTVAHIYCHVQGSCTRVTPCGSFPGQCPSLTALLYSLLELGHQAAVVVAELVGGTLGDRYILAVVA